MANGNGWQKATMALATLLSGLALGWTTATSQEVSTIKGRQTATEENVRILHYESQVQRKLLEQIAKAVGADVDAVLPVRPLREASQ